MGCCFFVSSLGYLRQKKTNIQRSDRHVLPWVLRSFTDLPPSLHLSEYCCPLYIYIYLMILLGKTRKNILKSGSPSDIIFLIYQVGIKTKEKGGNVGIRKADLKMPILWNCHKEKPTHKTVFLRMVTVNNKKKNQKWINCSATEQELSKYIGIPWRYCRFNSRPT